jgi:uncharacterized protein with PIN domain
VRALRRPAQLREVFDRLDLAGSARPFTRCLCCNGLLLPVDKAGVAAQLPPSVAQRFDRFARCADCARVYWEGSHWRRMRQQVSSLTGA